MSQDKKYSSRQVLKELFQYVRPHRVSFYLTTVFTFSAAFISPLRPWLIQNTVDQYIAYKNMPGLLNMTMILIGVLMLEVLIQFSQTYLANFLGQSIIKDIRNKLYQRLIHYKLAFYDKTPIGNLVTRVVSDIETISDVFSQGILMIIGDILKLIVVLVVMFMTDWKLTLICISTLPLLILSANLFKNAVKKSFQDVRNQVAALNTFVQEHLTGMMIVQVFNREKQEMEKFKIINKKHEEANIRSVWAYSVFFPVVEVLSAISLALLVWWGTKGVIAYEVSFGSLVAFILYIHMLFRPIRQIADNFNILQMGMVSSERVFRIMNEDMHLIHGGEHRLETCQGKLSFNHIWFAYQQEDWVLKDFSLDIKPGETIAVVGATGAGKTSLINILGRFYEYQKGHVFLDDIDIKTINIDDYRSFFSIVTQDVFLFSDTILNNITLGREDISLEQVIDAAKMIGVHDFIMKLPDHYFYNVRERGNTLSVGQRQLVSFLRAYILKPQILILDEATSSIDHESEMLIQNAISQITRNRTSIVIAHRLSTIQNAHKILVLEKGQILEMGTHEELIHKEGQYKKLYDLQFV